MFCCVVRGSGWKRNIPLGNFAKQTLGTPPLPPLSQQAAFDCGVREQDVEEEVKQDGAKLLMYGPMAAV